MKEIKVTGNTYFVTEQHEQNAEKLGLDNQYIRTRLRNDWTVDEAYSAPKGTRLEDYREIQQVKAIEGRNKQRLEKLYIEKERRARPHLYDGTPQPPYPMGDWRKHLGENDIFPKRKVE